MDKLLVIFCIFVGIAYASLAFTDGIVALAVAGVFAAAIIVFIHRNADEDAAGFLVKIFVIALSLRLSFGLFVHIFELRGFFGEDSLLYNILGERIAEIWSGESVLDDSLTRKALDKSATGWGMNYIIGAIYFLVGKNVLAAQAFFSLIGAATAPLVYFCAYSVFKNHRVGKLSAILVALFPAFTIWSAQLMKDGVIIFLLVLTMTMVLQLQKKFNYLAIGILILSLFGILSLRFYIFYIVVIAVAGSFVIGLSSSGKSIVRGMIALVAIFMTLAFFGVFQTATTQFEKFGNLESVQRSRQDLARSAESGYGEDLDVSTTEGAITTLPIGFAYLMLAPFPWQISNLRQAITLPEMIVWWASLPLFLSGLWFTLKNRLRGAISILIFTFLLTIAYSIFQGNVGTAYRQRAQIQVFMFIFISVGWTLHKERRENREIAKENARHGRKQ